MTWVRIIIMTKWIPIAKTSEIPSGSRKVFDINDRRVAIFNVNDHYYAIESICTHAMFELDDAPLEDCTIICPLHGARFSLETGAVLSPPAYEDLVTFAVQIEGDMIYVSEDPN